MLTFMHMTCKFQLWDIFVNADLYTSNYSAKMAKIGSYEYFLVLFVLHNVKTTTNLQNGY